MRILVIGGSGFIGTRLVGRLLAAGHDVVIADIVRSGEYPERWVPCDMRDLGALRAVMKGHDAVLHLAAEHKDNVMPRSLYDEVNVEGARLVCRAATERGGRADRVHVERGDLRLLVGRASRRLSVPPIQRLRTDEA